MKKSTWMFVALLLSFFLCVPYLAHASIIGLYYRGTGDKLSVFIKENRPFLKIEVKIFPDLPQCNSFQIYPSTPFEHAPLELVTGPNGKGTGFALWQSQECLKAYWEASKKGATQGRSLIQEIDIYNDFFVHFTNSADLIRGFEAGEFFLAVMFQENYDGYESMRREVYYTYQDVVNGKALLK